MLDLTLGLSNPKKWEYPEMASDRILTTYEIIDISPLF